MTESLRSALAVLALVSCLRAPACLAGPDKPVTTIGPDVISVRTGILPLFASQKWSVPDAGIVRAVVVLQGLHRNAEGYFHDVETGKEISDKPGATTLVIAPQFLDQLDIKAHQLGSKMLRWRGASWESGDPAAGPVPVSSFDILDAILAQLANKVFFPNLKDVVVAGHSGGGQLAQRYAMASPEAEHLAQQGIHVRFVVANPSSYAYFGPERPAPVATCPNWNSWKYGLQGNPADFKYNLLGLPPYISHFSPAQLEYRYVAHRVIYLLGQLDTNPQDPELDTSCQAEAQGPNRLARGRSYVTILRSRDGGAPNHSLWEVPDVAHDANGMFNSACGRAALFDIPGCAAHDAEN